MRPLLVLVALAVAATQVGALNTPAPPPNAAPPLPTSDSFRGCTTNTFGYVPAAMENTMDGDECAFDFYFDTPIAAVSFTCTGPGTCRATVQGPWYLYPIQCSGTSFWTQVRLPDGTIVTQASPTCGWGAGGGEPTLLLDWFADVRITHGTAVANLTICTGSTPAAPCPT